jgi:hypothetical protein
MDPIAAQNVDLVKAIQALLVNQGTAAEGSALLALIGQEVDVLFQALTSDGVKLQLPSGQTVTAQGELPYPEGTQLRVRIQPPTAEDPAIRLQLQEARPPALPALLSPLIQGEAQTLATRLSQETLPPELAPLLKLLSVLTDASPGGNPLPLPSADNLQAAFRQLPETLLTSLGKALGVGGLATTQELVTALQSLFQDAQEPLPDPTARLLNNLVGAAPAESDPAQNLQNLVQQVVNRFQALAAQHPEIPEDNKDFLTTWIQNQLQKAATAENPPQLPAKPALAAPAPAPRAESLPRPSTDDALILPKLLTALEARPGPKAAVPESWESWIRGTVATLTDPAVSPKEATFHALQAKEGTAFFEIPLPWAQASPLQIWVEADAPEGRQARPDMTKRVLLGLRFSHLGETRLGMAQGTFGLQIRIWTERPETLEADKAKLEAELKELGRPVDLRIYALTYRADGTIPTVRSLVVGPSISALG